jgi:hypothetical protein
MCFATMALGGSLLGGALTAGGTLESGFASSHAADYAAQVAANNAIIARQNAKFSLESGEAQAAATSLKGASQSGRIKSAQAASGVDVNTGSAVDVQASQRELNKLDTETTLHKGQLAAYGYRTQATNYDAEAALKRGEASQDITGAEIGAAGSLIGGASGTAFKWSQINPPTTPNPGPDSAWPTD